MDIVLYIEWFRGMGPDVVDKRIYRYFIEATEQGDNRWEDGKF